MARPRGHQAHGALQRAEREAVQRVLEVTDHQRRSLTSARDFRDQLELNCVGSTSQALALDR
jgi:hypothetical protein